VGRGSTDYDQAAWLADVLEKRYRYDHTTEKWHRWDPESGIWKRDQVNDLMEEINQNVDDVIMAINDRKGEHYIQDEEEREATTKSFMKLKMTNNQHRAMEALSTLASYKTDGSDWDQNPYLLGCANGVVDLRVNALVKPDPDNLVTRSTKHVFKPVHSWDEGFARAPQLIESGLQWTSDDSSLVLFYLLWFGYSLFGLNTEQRFLILTGIGRNGKGALMKAMRNVFGEYSASVSDSMYMRSRFGSSRSDNARPDLMELKGRRLAAMSEPEGGAFNEEMLKAHTGGDPITARSLYSNNVISWEPTHSIVILTNHAPKVDDIGPSMAARVMVADFQNQYTGDKEDKDLYTKLTTEPEAEGQLALLAFAAQWWHEHGLTIPERVTQASQNYIASSDPVGRAIDDVFVQEKGARGPAQVMYAQYLEWHTQNNEEGEPLSGTAFGLALKRHGLDKKKMNNGWYYLGIRPKSAMEIASEGTDDDA
jgi:putative DNA primase/helicase